MRKILIVMVVAFISGLLGAYTFSYLGNNKQAVTIQVPPVPNEVQTVNYGSKEEVATNFVKASKATTSSVVFIKTLSKAQNYRDPFNDFWSNWDFFGRRGPVSSSGSGVILSKDGYIVTNNHVVKDADEIEVILNNNKNSFKAELIGTDPSTDLAVLKIKGKDLPAITLGNSDALEVGDWVLAVGNPFNLTSTVTAGIVSAKGRNINIVNNQFPIESFIQTDAAINPGNSGGALVNVTGELVGINTAIATQTGVYNGYGFAIPVNIVAKIVNDLIEFGEVQRGFPGIEVKDIDGKLAEQLNLDAQLGVYVDYVLEEGPADKAGVELGDLLIKVDDKEIESKALFDEQISYHRPGDKIKVVLLRKNKPVETTITLLNREGTTKLLKKQSVTSTTLGADFQVLSKVEKDRYGVDKGIRIFNMRNGRLRRMNIPEGFIVTKFNKKEYDKAEDLIKAFEEARGQIVIEGLYANGGRGYFSFYSR